MATLLPHWSEIDSSWRPPKKIDSTGRSTATGFSTQAIRHCLGAAGITIRGVDHVGISRDPSAHLHKTILLFYAALRRDVMKVLILNQAFYPDVVSTAQHAPDLAVAASDASHQVTVMAAARGYDNPLQSYPRRETWKGVRILRVGSTGFGKTTRWRRAFPERRIKFQALLTTSSGSIQRNNCCVRDGSTTKAGDPIDGRNLLLPRWTA
jgi:hypothetical protein